MNYSFLSAEQSEADVIPRSLLRGEFVNKRFIHSHAGDEAKEVDFLLYAAGF